MKEENNKVVNFEKDEEKKGLVEAFKELSTPKKIAIGAAGVLVIAGGVVLGIKMLKPSDIPVEEVAEALGDNVEVVEF